MSAAKEKWTVSIAVSLATGSRWLSGAGFLVTLVAVLSLHWLHASFFVAGILGIAALSGLFQLYLAVRIEFDRAIFAAIQKPPVSPGETLKTFDHVMHDLRLLPSVVKDRTLEQRVGGLIMLIRRSAILLVAQFVLLLAAIWMAR